MTEEPVKQEHGNEEAEARADPSSSSDQPVDQTHTSREDEPRRTNKQDAEEDDELNFDPDQDRRLRFEREQGRRNFSWTPFEPSFSRTVNDSGGVFTQGDSSPAAGAVFGHVIGSVNVGLGRRPHLIQQVSREHLDSSAAAFIQELRNDGTTVLDELIHQITSGRVCILAGPPGSGRTALAVRGLHATLPPSARIAIFALSTDPDQLREMNLRRNDGYVVDIRPAVARRPLDDIIGDIAGFAEQRQTHIVVIVDKRTLPAGWVEYPVVRHEAPNHLLVLRTLLVRVHGLTDEQVNTLPSGILSEAGSVTMTGLAQAAAAVAAAIRSGEPAGTYLRQVVRQQVARKFDQPTDDIDDSHDAKAADPGAGRGEISRAERVHTFRRCCMLSAATFNGLPLPIVTAAAAELSQILQAGDPDARAVSNLFEQPVDLLLRWLDARLTPNAT